jgi:hypothetical protein
MTGLHFVKREGHATTLLFQLRWWMMRGDAFGNTLYSECWVIKILMKLAKVRSTSQV